MARLFFALWPDEAAKAKLSAQAKALQSQCAGHAVQPANLHLTLAFLGATPDARRAAIEAAAGRVTGCRFELRLARLGQWRDIIWAGCAAPPPALLTLVADLHRELVACGCVLEPRPFQPHLTLLRKAAHGCLPAHESLPRLAEPIAWAVVDWCLVASQLGTGSVQYQELARWSLGADLV